MENDASLNISNVVFFYCINCVYGDFVSLILFIKIFMKEPYSYANVGRGGKHSAASSVKNCKLKHLLINCASAGTTSVKLTHINADYSNQPHADSHTDTYTQNCTHEITHALSSWKLPIISRQPIQVHVGNPPHPTPDQT